MDKFAERSVAEIERRIRKIYSQAAAEIAEDMDKYLQKFRKKDAMLRAKVLKGEITEDEYRRWKQGQVFAGDQWLSRQRQATGKLLFANQMANAIVEGKRLEVFADGANYQAYEFERDTGIGIAFDLLNEQAVERLIRDEPELLPRRKVDRDKDRGWNQTNIANAVTQSILQGESMEEAAKRIGRDTGITNEKAMMRYARTAVNGAENAGSLQGLREIQAMGIHVQKQWVATLDSKTRDAHQDLDGQVADLDEPFDSPLGPIDHPGDPSAAAGNVYNCRCTIKAYYPQYADMISGERRRRAYNDPDSRESVLVGDMTYKEWKAQKMGASTQNVAQQATREKRIRDRLNLIKGLPDDFKQGMADTLLASGNETALQLFDKYADQLVCYDADRKAGAHYSRLHGGTAMNAEAVARGSNYQTPFEVAFHEFGHMIDNISNPGIYYLSETPINGVGLLDIIKSDFKAFKKASGAKNNGDLLEMLKRERMDLRTCGNISDILEKCLNKSYPLGIGHGTAYHKRDGATVKEFFAEVIDSAVANKPAYEQMRRIFPNAVDAVWKLIEGVL